jgi:hypothetical protein
MNLKIFLLLFLFLFSSLILANTDSYSLRESSSSLDDCIFKGGGMLNSSFTLRYSEYSCNGRSVVQLQGSIDQSINKLKYKFLDELRLPLFKGKRKLLDIDLCRSDKYKEKNIIAVGEWETTKSGDGIYAKEISNAWRFNLESGKIEAISVDGVVCEGLFP